MATINNAKVKYIALGLSMLVLLTASVFSYRIVSASKIYETSIHYEEEGNLVKAKEGYKKAISLNPWHADANYQLGGIMKKEGNIDEALRLMHRAVELNGDEPDYNLGLAFLYLNYIEDVDKARHYFSEAYSSDNNSYYACYMLGKLEESERNYNKAIAYYEEAIKINPDLTTAYKQLANLYDVKGMNQQVNNYWQRVLELNPEDEDAQAYFENAN